MANSKSPIIGLDWESGDYWMVSYNGKAPEKISKKEFLVKEFPENARLVAEGCHTQPKNRNSRSQVYSLEELEGVSWLNQMQLAPNRQISKMAIDVGNVLRDKKGDSLLDDYGRARPDKSLDSVTLAMYAKKYPATLATWKRMVLPSEDPSHRLHGPRGDLREDIKDVVNPIRAVLTDSKDCEVRHIPGTAVLYDFLERHFDSIPEEMIKEFDIKYVKNELRITRGRTPLLVTFLMVADRNGNLRRNPSGGFIGLDFIKGAIGFSHSNVRNFARGEIMKWRPGGAFFGYATRQRKAKGLPKPKEMPITPQERSEYMAFLTRQLQFFRDSIAAD